MLIQKTSVGHFKLLLHVFSYYKNLKSYFSSAQCDFLMSDFWNFTYNPLVGSISEIHIDNIKNGLPAAILNSLIGHISLIYQNVAPSFKLSGWSLISVIKWCWIRFSIQCSSPNSARMISIFKYSNKEMAIIFNF